MSDTANVPRPPCTMTLLSGRQSVVTNINYLHFKCFIHLISECLAVGCTDIYYILTNKQTEITACKTGPRELQYEMFLQFFTPSPHKCKESGE